jgi:hypothetical protein
LLTTQDGVDYRTNAVGNYWERAYGESWEPVYLNEEEYCVQAFKNYFSTLAQR